MLKNTTKIALVTLAISLTGCTYEKMSAEDAIQYQSVELIRAANVLYASQSGIPDGEITKALAAVSASNFVVQRGDIFSVNSMENMQNRDAMLRLKPDVNSGDIVNEFGGVVKVFSDQNRISIVYTKVPSSVNCNKIRFVTCEGQPI